MEIRNLLEGFEILSQHPKAEIIYMSDTAVEIGEGLPVSTQDIQKLLSGGWRYCSGFWSWEWRSDEDKKPWLECSYSL